jgi:hypothetical protein
LGSKLTDYINTKLTSVLHEFFAIKKPAHTDSIYRAESKHTSDRPNNCHCSLTTVH